MAERRFPRTAITFVALIALFLVASSTAPSTLYPIEPRPLRRLVSESQFIVTAKVTSPDAKAIRNDQFATDVVLEIDEVLKGKLDTKRIPQTNNLGMICPAPARYDVDTRVLAFLDWEKEYGFTTHALSYGAKALDDAAMKTYLERVKEELAILVMTDATAQRKAQVEWLVKCCEDPATRWEGAFDLAPRGDPITGMFDGNFLDGRAAGSTTPECKFDEGFARELSDPQRQRLRDAWYASKRFDHGEMCLDELFLADRDPKALAWFVARLRDALKLREGDDDEDDTYDLLQRLVRRDDRPVVAALAKKFSESLGNFSLHSELLPYRVKLLSDLLALY
ncbi:MAG TPA: hypothetical protein VFG37_15965 [Planctomycetota bacterium]|nr:hypothetical protein [Planctomycetota bacterium]